MHNHDLSLTLRDWKYKLPTQFAYHLWVRSLSRAFAWYRCFVGSSFLRADILRIRSRNSAFNDRSRSRCLHQWAPDPAGFFPFLRNMKLPHLWCVTHAYTPPSQVIALPSHTHDVHMSHTCVGSGTDDGLSLLFLFFLPLLSFFDSFPVCIIAY